MNLGISNDIDDPKVPPPYLTLYNLTRAPFSPEHAPAFFYTDPESTSILSSLQGIDETSNEVLLVSGPEGCGKSMLLQQFLEHSSDEWQVCHLQARKGSGEEFLLGGIRDCFNIEPSLLKPEQQLGALRQQLDNLRQQSLAVLVIDDAHLLDEEALYLVMQLAGMTFKQGALMRVMLFVEDSIDTVLAAERFADFSEPLRYQRNPLDELQTAIYLNHRLQAAGYTGRTLFSNREVKQIHRHSQGIPGSINEEAHHVMMLRWQAGGHDASGNLHRYLKIGGAVAGGLVVVLLLQSSLSKLIGGGESNTESEQALPEFEYAGNNNDVVAKRHVSEENTRAGVTTDNGEDAGEEKIEIPMALPQALTQPADESRTVTAGRESNTIADEEAPLVVKTDSGADQSLSLKLTGVEPSPLITSNKPQRLVIKGTGLVEGSRIALNRAGAVTLLSDGQVEWISDNALAITVITGEIAADWAVQVGTPDNRLSNVLFFKVVPPEKKNKPVTEATTEQEKISKSQQVASTKSDVAPPTITSTPEKMISGAVKGNGTPTLLGSEWLNVQPLQNYTLQLLASTSKFNVTAFVREHSLSGTLASIATEKDGSRYYLLVQGSYATREAADQAARQLPDGLDSWPRTIESVRQEMVAVTQTETANTAPASQAGIKDTAWVWSQDPNRYTVQLAAAESEASIQSVSGQLGLPGELVVVQTLHEGRHWYVLIYGSYASKEAAHKAIDRLPLSLQKTGPWPRSFASLQSELSKATP